LRDAAVGLRWTLGRKAWNCLRSVLALAGGSSAGGLSAGRYHSAGGHKNESNTESLEHRVSPQTSVTSEEPRGFSDELIFPRGNKSQKAPDLGTEPDQGHALCRRFRGRGGAPGECQISLFRLQRFQLSGKKWGHAPTFLAMRPRSSESESMVLREVKTRFTIAGDRAPSISPGVGPPRMGSLLALSTRMASPNIRVCTRSVISMRASASTGEPMAAWGSPPRSCKNAWVIQRSA